MKRQSWIGLVIAAFLMLGAAQAQVTVSVAEHPEFGTYLTDGEGMTLYLFVQDAATLATPAVAEERMTEGVRAEAAQCTEGCLENWPPLLADGGQFTIAAEAEGQLDPELLYVADVDGRSQLVYNGWPLYYFANDAMAGDVNGQGAADKWFVIAPAGNAAGEVAGGGAAETEGTDTEGTDTEGTDTEGEPAEDTEDGAGGEDGADGAADGDAAGADDAADGEAGATDDGAADGAADGATDDATDGATDGATDDAAGDDDQQ